ncbi:MAG: FtsX-like permease family protein [Lachnospiraceae bacterium]|nr:FtsX-like permease family protein [Lachnospiraceae bacterium]
MNHKLLTRLALDGMKNNRKTVLPFILVSVLNAVIYYIFVSLAYSHFLVREDGEVFYGAGQLTLILTIASWVVTIIAALFVLYGNQFVMKNRRKEMGLYGVLGLSKKNLTRIMFTEFLVQLFSILSLGILIGTFLNKLMLLLLYKVVKQPPVEGMMFSPEATIRTAILFTAVLFVCLVQNLLSVQFGNPIDLLHSDHMGEKEPKVKILLLFVGTVCLAAGYIMALQSKGTFDAISKLFSSILFVIIGTYALFTAGTIFILKVLKKRRGFYYKTRHFISVSNLMFRMKHNAAGLASICILSTGVILLLVCASSLMMLGEQNINTMFPTDVMIHGAAEGEAQESVYESALTDAITTSGIEAENVVCREYTYSMACLREGRLEQVEGFNFGDLSQLKMVYFMTLEDYNRYKGEQETLKEGEILVYYNGHSYKAGDTLRVFGHNYTVKRGIKEKGLHQIFDPTMILFDRFILILPTWEDIAAAMGEEGREVFFGEEGASMRLFYLGFDYEKEPSAQQIQSFAGAFSSVLPQFAIEYKAESRTFFYSLYGGVFFVGLFLAVMFLIVTVVIIYYKQISEGFEDRARFEILSNVGLTDREAKKTIGSQVMLLFFLPVCTAVVHMAFASNILRQFLNLLVYVDNRTFILSIALVCILFFGVYAIVYKLTSREYYRIVYGK